jgi:hypothetical protein
LVPCACGGGVGGHRHAGNAGDPEGFILVNTKAADVESEL